MTVNDPLSAFLMMRSVLLLREIKEQLEEVRLNSEARVSLVHKQMCYLYEGSLDVPRQWLRKANPTKVPIDDVKEYFRVVFNEFFSNLKSGLLSRLSALEQQTGQGLQLSPKEPTIWTRQWLPQT